MDSNDILSNGHDVSHDLFEAAQPEAKVLDPQVLGAVYSYLLSLLSLSPKHRGDLHLRGFSDEDIQTRGYGSFPIFDREKIAKKVVEYFGEDVCSKVPGFYKIDGQWNLCGAPGLIIPQRNIRGLVLALKVRSDRGGRNKYPYLSSKNRPGGTGPTAEVHVPLYIGDTNEIVRVTEGELKADVATILGGKQTLSIPGVAMWRKLPDVLREMGFRAVELAFDMDCFKNPAVARAVSNAARCLIEEGFEVILETWDRSHKGIDDALLANVPINKHQGQEAENMLGQMLREAEEAESRIKNEGPSKNSSDSKKKEYTDREMPQEDQEGDPFSPLIELSNGCAVVAKLLSKSKSGDHMSNSERLRLAQIAIGVGLANGVIVDLYRGQANFNLEKTLSAIRSLRTGHRLASCKRISEDLGICDGKCDSKRAVNGWSPNHLLAKDDKRVLPAIQVNERQIRHVIKDSWKAAHGGNEPEPILFNRLGSAVRLVDRKENLQIEMLGAVDMFGHLARCANWFRATETGAEPTKPDTQVASDMLAYTDDQIKTPLAGKTGFRLFRAVANSLRDLVLKSFSASKLMLSGFIFIIQNLLGQFPELVWCLCDPFLLEYPLYTPNQCT
jgi:hypothetical protein